VERRHLWPLAKRAILIGADANAADSEGCTPLIRSCVESDNSAVISELLNWNANINWRDQLGRTALICASIGHVENVRAILRGSPDVNVVAQNYETALSFAVVWGRIEIIRCLLEAGADPYWRDPRGWTILDYAEASRDAAVIAVVRSYLDPSEVKRDVPPEQGPQQ
jgi:ankyrin repeat protein